MSRKYKFYNPDGVYFVTFSVVRWIDLFTRNLYRDILLDSFRYCQNEKGLVIHAYVIMSNHVHMIIASNGNNRLENIMRDLKKFTSFKLFTSNM